MNKEEIIDKIALLIFAIIVVGIVVLIIYIPALIDKKICESNGGVYIWSFNEYSNRCHLKGENNV